MGKEKEAELRSKLDKVKIEPEELRKLSAETASKLSKHRAEILKTLDKRD